MDEIQDYEIQTLSEYLNWSHYSEWQQTRMLFYAILKPYLKNQNATPEELLPLNTDNDYDETEIEISNDDINNLRSKAERMKNIIISKNE